MAAAYNLSWRLCPWRERIPIPAGGSMHFAHTHLLEHDAQIGHYLLHP